MLDRSIRLLNRLEDILLVALLCVMIALAFLQIVLRDFFSTGFLWADSLVRNLVVWIGLLGASIATREDKHIVIDLLPKLLTQTARVVVSSIASFFSALVCFALVYASLSFLADEFHARTIAFARIPAWPLQVIFPLCFLVMGIRFGAQSVRHTASRFKQDSK